MVSIFLQCDRSISLPDTPFRDTVSSVGIMKAKCLASTNTCDHVRYFRQALALDERRVKFLPEYVYGGTSDRTNWSKDESAQPPKDEDHIKEVWFAGSHSDVYVALAPQDTSLITGSSGGGSREKTRDPLDFRDMPLIWMREEALEAGLELEPPKVAFKYENFKEPKITKSLTLPWWLLEVLPIRRLRYNSKEDTAQ